MVSAFGLLFLGEKPKDLSLHTATVSYSLPTRYVLVPTRIISRFVIRLLEYLSPPFLHYSLQGERIEIIYNNISVGAFVPCIGTEHNVTLHFHLKHPILIGKKKHQDIQFFTDVFATSEELDKKQRSEYDPDEFGEEDRERELRRTLNQDFLRFVRRTEDLMQLDGSSFRSFDIAQEEMVFIVSKCTAHRK